jgi:hypothetical protein
MLIRHMRTTAKIALLLCATAISTIAPAASSVAGFVTASSGAPSNAEFSSALIQVLRKISGNPNIDTIGSLNQIISNPQSLVNNFNRQQRTDAQGNKLRLLAVNFNTKAVYKALRDSDQNIWPLNTRPKVLILIKQPDDVSLVDNNTNNALQNTAAWQAKILGIPLIWPIADLQDNQALTQPITPASARAFKQRYMVKNILSASTQQGKIIWYTNLDGNTSRWTSSTDKNWLEKGLLHFLDMFSNNYATASSGNASASVLINVSNINDFQDLAQATKCLKQNSLLSSTQITENNASSFSMSATAIDLHDLVESLHSQANGICKFSNLSTSSGTDHNNNQITSIHLTWSGDKD